MLYVIIGLALSIALFIIIPKVINKLFPKLEQEKQVLFAMTIHVIVIVSVLISVWKFQNWKNDYADHLQGLAFVDDQHAKILRKDFPELSAADEMLMKVLRNREESMLAMTKLGHRLDAHKPFLKMLNGHWINQIERLSYMRKLIAKETHKFQLALKTGDEADVYRNFRNISYILVQKTYEELEETRKSDQVIAEKLLNHVKFAIQLLRDNPKASISRKIQYSAENYKAILDYTDDVHPELVTYLEDSYKIVLKANSNQKMLQKALGQDSEIDQLVYKMIQDWRTTKGAVQTKLIRVLYILEIEMIARRLDIPKEHPLMAELYRLLEHRVPDIYASIKQAERRAAESYSRSALSALIDQR